MSERISAGTARAGVHPAQQWLEEMETWELIPPMERNALLSVVTEAVDLAEAGQVEAGHEILLTGLQRAEDHWNGNPWGGDLVLSYQAALDRYAHHYSR